MNFVLSLLGIYFFHAYLLTKLTVYCEKNITDALGCTLCAPHLFLNFEYQLRSITELTHSSPVSIC